jgi:hypothetical protein
MRAGAQARSFVFLEGARAARTRFTLASRKGSIRHHTLVMFEREMNSEASSRACLIVVKRAAKISAAKRAKGE